MTRLLSKCLQYTVLTLFDCSKCPQTGFLGFGQAPDMRDVHALIWPFRYQCIEALIGLQIPAFDCSIVTATGKHILVGAESHPPHPVDVSMQRSKAISGMDVPQANGRILAAAGEQVPVRTESDRPDPTRMASQDYDAASGMDVPQADALILAAARQELSARAKSNRAYPAGVPF